jgi:hypothetical protein
VERKAVELKGSGEVQIVAGVKDKESGDQTWVALNDAELAAELLFPIGQAMPTPSPLPVREAAV